MSESERAGPSTASARSLHVAHFMPIAWPAVAARVAPMVARADRSATTVQSLILVPAAADAIALHRALRALDATADAGIAVLSTPRRAKRVIAAGPAQVVVGTPAVVQGLVAASALRLADVTSIGIVAADEFEADAARLDLVLGECPRGAAKTLVAAAQTPFVDRLIEAQMHGARHLAATPAEPGAATPVVEYVPVTSGAEGATLADVLEIVDAPSAAIVPADSAREAAAREALAEYGYPADSTLARVAPGGETGGAALVVLLGAPSGVQWTAMMAVPPVRVVALVTMRERRAMAAALPGARLVPFAATNARGEAMAAEEALRDRIRRAIGESYPAREMLALEPLLGEFDALVLAGAALRMLERERETARRMADARPATPAPDRPAQGTAQRERPPRGDDRGRPPRSDDRGRPPRSGDRGRPQRSDDRGRPPRSDDRGRPPRGDDRRGPPRNNDRTRPPRPGDRTTRTQRPRE